MAVGDPRDQATVKGEEPYEERISLPKIVRFLLLLSFYPTWNHITVLCILYNFLSHTYVLVYYTTFYGYYFSRFLMDVLFFLDVLLCILHKILYDELKSNHIPRETHLIILDIVTLISFDYAIDFGRYSRQNPYFVIMNVFSMLRIYRIYMYAVNQKRKVGKKPLIQLLVTLTCVSYVILHELTCLYTIIIPFENAPWTAKLVYKAVEVNKGSDKFYLTMYFVTVILNGIGYGDLHPATTVEYYMVIIIEILGIMYLSVTISMLVAYSEDKLNFQFEFHQRYYLINEDLKRHKNLPRVTANKILDFYECLWTYKAGSLESSLFPTLPENMKCLVFMDQYWETLQKSSILRHLDLPSKRALASQMRSQMHVTGDVIIRQGEIRTFMIYIVRGFVKVLSSEDTESTIVMLSEGTLLFEASLVLSTPSPVQIEAGSLCELQILDRVALFSTATVYQKISGIVLQAFMEMFRKSIHTKFDIRHKRILSRAMRIEEVVDQSKEKPIDARIETPYTWLHENEMSHLTYKSKTMKDSLGIYIKLKKSNFEVSDALCTYGKFPFSFRPDTPFLFLWDLAVFIAVVICSFYYPLRAAIWPADQIDISYFPLDIVYIVDLFISTMTAVENNGKMLSSFKDIIGYRLTHLNTLAMLSLDILCILPFKMFYHGESSGVKALLDCHRILKSWKIIRFYRIVENKYAFPISAVRITECTLCNFIISVWMGCIYYLQACFDGECRDASFYSNICMQAMTNGYYERITAKVEMIMLMGLGLLGNSGFPDNIPINTVEIIILLVISVISSLILGYIVGTYSAALVLLNAPKIAFVELVDITKIFMDKNNMHKKIQERVLLFLKLQWDCGKGFYILNNRFLYYDTPSHLLYDLLSFTRRESILSVEILEETEQTLCNYIANHAEFYHIPPNEIVVYAGTPCNAFYVIKQGFCVKYSGITGEKEGIYGPKSNFCVMEMLFGIPATSEIRTATNVMLLRITLQQLLNALSHFPLTKNEIFGLVKEFKDEDALRMVITRKKVKVEETFQKAVMKSLIKFDRRSEEYVQPFRGNCCNKILKLILMPVTITPHGQFLKIWETYRIVCVLLAGTFFPPYSYLQYTSPYMVIGRVFFDIMTFFDMYIACHVCYFNDKGVLVTHPRATFQNYITHNFIVDLIGLFPFDILTQEVDIQDSEGFKRVTTPSLFAFFPKTFLLYHVLSIEEFRVLDKRERHEVLLTDILIMYITFIIMNFSATILVILTSKILHKRGVEYRAVFKKQVWFGTKKVKETIPESIFYVHIMAVYWTVTLDFNVLPGDILPVTRDEIIYVVTTFLAGYGIVAFMMVRCSSTSTGLGIYYTMFKEKVRQLEIFLKSKAVNFRLRKEILDHFIYVWNTTRTLEPQSIFSKFHSSLEEDAVAYLYEPTFKESSMFQDKDFSFYRGLSMQVRERYYTKGSIILRINDVVADFFIIHSGEVNIVSASDIDIVKLARGSVFGNFDNNARTRITYSANAITPVVLLKINNRKLYKVLEDYPLIVNDLMKMTANNKTFILGRKILPKTGKSLHRTDLSSDILFRQKAFEHRILRTLTRRMEKKIQMTVDLTLLLCAAVSFIVITYHASFQDHTPPVFAIEIVLTFIFLGKMLWSLYMPPFNEEDEWMSEEDLRRRHMRKWNGFILDFSCCCPVFLFSLLAPKDEVYEIWSYLNFFNFPRSYYLIKLYYSQIMDITTDVAFLELMKILICTAYSMHISSCLIYIAACFKNQCSPTKWAFWSERDELTFGDYPTSRYLCAFYAATNIYTGTAIGTFVPEDLCEVCMWTFVILVGKFHVYNLIGQITALVYNYNFTLNNYNYKVKILMTFLKCCNLSHPLMKHIQRYVELLWSCGNFGLQKPVLIDNMPPYLKGAMMELVYGQHIHYNPVFVDCHPDFSRQLMMHMKPVKFFPNNVIVQKGVLDGTMYFVDEGSVQVITFTENEYTIVHTLLPGDVFGVIQCFYRMTPHVHTFRAISDSVILTLSYDDWSYLLPFFPETYRKMYERLHEYFFDNLDLYDVQ